MTAITRSRINGERRAEASLLRLLCAASIWRTAATRILPLCGASAWWVTLMCLLPGFLAAALIRLMMRITRTQTLTEALRACIGGVGCMLVSLLLGALLLVGKLNVLAYIAFGVALATLVADAALYPTRQNKLAAERVASEKRLSDPGYARALKKAGYDIPERYLKEEESK